MRSDESTPQVFEYRASYRLLGDGAEIAAVADAPVRLLGEYVELGGEFGRTHVISYRNVADISSREYRIELDLVTGEQLTLYHLGRHFEGFLRDLNRLRNDLLVRDHLAYEGVIEEGVEADYQLDEFHRETRGRGEVRLYRSSLVLSTEGDGIIHIPYGLIFDVIPGDYSLGVVTEYGTRLELSGMGRAHDHLMSRLSETLDGLAAETARELDEIMPRLGPGVISRLTPLLRDGRAASKGELEEIAPGIWEAFLEHMDRLGCRDYYEYLRELSGNDEAFVGVKRGLMGGDDPEHYLWFLVPMTGAPPGPGNALAMEAAGGDGGRATYFFRLKDRDGYPGMSAADPNRAVRDTVSEVNRCMMSINFRREPIYLSAERLGEPRYEHYAAAVAALPTLRRLRELFLGRAFHRSPESWREDVMELLTSNAEDRDDSAGHSADDQKEGELQ
ncbi:MAG: hypothetical protein ACLFS8_06200 [Clostridia bacterium]